MYLLWIGAPAFGKVVRCAEADNAAPKNDRGGIAGAHRGYVLG
jgi:hypothetical protein